MPKKQYHKARPKNKVLFKEPPLPMSRTEMEARGWKELDILLVSGDAYIDHPSFGVPLLGRWLVSKGYRVGIVAQPRWNNTDDFTLMGVPRLFVGLSAGTMDSMLAHYTAFKKIRNDDAYTPGGRHGARPNRASIIYTNLAKRAFPGVPVVLGGVEASLRRATHYDFWTDKLRRSVLLDSKADLLVYGMGERAVLEIAERLKACHPEQSMKSRRLLLQGIAGTVYASSEAPGVEKFIEFPSHEAIEADPKALMDATLAMEQQVHLGTQWAVQDTKGRKLIFCPPAAPLETEEMDALYDQPYTRRSHPSYREPIPAEKMIQFSITSHRGCAGGCTFCSITLHQGRAIRSRSAESIQEEARQITKHPDFTGSISDVGGPTANMWKAYCDLEPGICKRPDCLTPKVCSRFKTNGKAYINLLRNIEALEGVKNLRVASGVRYDLESKNNAHLHALVSEFVGGQLKIAPEHSCDHILKLMRKPRFEKFEDFLELFAAASEDADKEQYVIPYLITAFPGCTDDDMHRLQLWLRERGWRPQQVQCFLPTPGAVATAMYYAEIDTKGNPIHVAKSDDARLRQHKILIPRTLTSQRR